VKQRALLLALALWACACAGPAQAALRDGDIVFQTSRSAQSQVIQLATHSPYSHMGLVLFRNGQPFVLEAIAHVQLTPLKEWAARGDGGRYAVKRLRDASVLGNPTNLSVLREVALSFVGKPYDPYFEWTDDRLYCSELVWKAYERALGIQLGRLAPITSFDLTSELVKAAVEQRYGGKVPPDEQVISPATIFDSPLLQQAR
jgi:cell wall-associated NlpC family hydrolase